MARQVELERRAVRIVVVDRNRERADVDGIVELSPLDRLRFERRWGRSCAGWCRAGRLRQLGQRLGGGRRLVVVPPLLLLLGRVTAEVSAVMAVVSSPLDEHAATDSATATITTTRLSTCTRLGRNPAT